MSSFFTQPPLTETIKIATRNVRSLKAKATWMSNNRGWTDEFDHFNAAYEKKKLN